MPIDLSTWKPRSPAGKVTLQGQYVRLEPLAPEHADSLYAASMAPGAEARFRYLFESPDDRPGFDRWLTSAIPSRDPLYFAVVDASTGRCEGRQALMRMAPEHGVIELGSILWGPGMARSRLATEALYLTACHVFEALGYRRLEWKCHADNLPSRSAALRFGFQFEGLFRQHMVHKGTNRDTWWSAMTDLDWQDLKPGYDRWLLPENFDIHQQQRRSLQDCRAQATSGR